MIPIFFLSFYGFYKMAIDISRDFWGMVRVIVNSSEEEVTHHPLYNKFCTYAQMQKKKGQFRMHISSLPGLKEPDGKNWYSFDSVDDVFFTVQGLYEKYFRDSEDYWLLKMCMNKMLDTCEPLKQLQKELESLSL